VKYCNQQCMSVCLCACISQKPRIQTLQNFLHVIRGHGSVHRGWQCTSGFVGDIACSHNGVGSISMGAVLKQVVIDFQWILQVVPWFVWLFLSVYLCNDSKLHTGAKYAVYCADGARETCTHIPLSFYLVSLLFLSYTRLGCSSWKRTFWEMPLPRAMERKIIMTKIEPGCHKSQQI